MSLSLDDTIAALASAPGGAARGIVRISGQDVRKVLEAVFQPDHRDNWTRCSTASVHEGVLPNISSRSPVHVALYFWPDCRSYTGQPLAEMHVAGSPPLIERILAHLHCHGVRPARPGEFTLRAFLAGKLDLLQAEAVLGVIDAHDHAELQTALSQLGGGLSVEFSRLRHDLLELLADLEAGLDFIEEDITFIERCEVQARIGLAIRFVERLLNQSDDRMQSNTRFKVVLAGLPNAGKSTLFNRLSGSEFALVSPVSGTTRDFLTAIVRWRGLEFDIVDTAGWDNPNHGIDQSAQNMRSGQLESADLIVWCSAGHLDSSQQSVDQATYQAASHHGRARIRVLTQMDRPTARNWLQTELNSLEFIPDTEHVHETSAVDQCGLEDLLDEICSQLSAARHGRRQWLGMTAARCRETLKAVLIALVHAEEASGSETIGDELIAVDVRDALDHLGRILGVIYTDDILDRVFSKFCIGK